jgi:acyl-CoA synthetase (NDP forming)
MSSRHPLDIFFNPASVAVIGASTALHKAGGRRWRSMVEAGFRGPLYPIHPSAREILGRTTYARLRDVPAPVDIAVVARARSARAARRLRPHRFGIQGDGLRARECRGGARLRRSRCHEAHPRGIDSQKRYRWRSPRRGIRSGGGRTRASSGARAAQGKPRVLVTPMVTGAIEAVVGAFRDPQFGAVVMFGLGGVWVEALADVAFRLAPLAPEDALAMIGEIRARPLLVGSRGLAPRDVEAIVDVLVRIGELVSDRSEVIELDVNPLFLLERDAVVGDARVVLA